MTTQDEPTFDNGQAQKEGWSVFFANRASDHRYEIERIDDPSDLREAGDVDYEEPVFENDPDAIAFVVEKARSGSDYHVGALTYVRDLSPREYEDMAKAHDLSFLPAPTGPVVA